MLLCDGSVISRNKQRVVVYISCYCVMVMLFHGTNSTDVVACSADVPTNIRSLYPAHLEWTVQRGFDYVSVLRMSSLYRVLGHTHSATERCHNVDILFHAMVWNYDQWTRNLNVWCVHVTQELAATRFMLVYRGVSNKPCTGSKVWSSLSILRGRDDPCRARRTWMPGGGQSQPQFSRW